MKQEKILKVLLANPPGPWLRCRWDIYVDKVSMKYFPFPVRLAYATAALRKEGYTTKLVDATAEEYERKDFEKVFSKFSPDVVIWETTASSFEYDIETMKQLRKINPKLIMVASGYHATPTYKKCLEAGYDYVIVGECDYSIRDLIKYLDGKMKEFPKGVASKNYEPVQRPLIQNLDELPWPERDDLPMKKYNDPKLHGFNVVMISSRGCPYGCSFCTVDVYYEKRNYRMRDPKDVVDEMDFVWKKYKPDELYFDDDNFAVNEKHVRGICDELIGRKLEIKWNCMVDAKITDSLLELMKKAGCTGVTIGAESADDKVLKHIAKGITRKDIKHFVDICKKLKLRSHLCWVLGLPHSTKESDKETIEFALRIPSDTLQFSVCVPYPGTEMYKWCEKNNYFETKDWSKFMASDNAVVNLPGYSHKDIKEMLDYATKLWYKKMLFKKPNVILFHLYNIYKYQGLGGMIKVAKSGLKKIVR